MNKISEKLLPIIYILICALLCTFGFAALSIVLLSALLSSLCAQKGFKFYCFYAGISVIALFLAFGMNFTDASIYSAVFIALSISISSCILRKKSLSYTLISSALPFLAIICTVLVYFMKSYNVSAVDIIFGQYLKNAQALLIGEGDIAKEINDVVYYLSMQLDLLLPSILVLTSAFISYVTLSLTRWMLKKHGILIFMRQFSELRLWGSFTFIFIILDIVLVFIPTNPILSNVSIILTTIFVVCGVSVIDFYLKMKRFKTPVRILIYVAGFLALSALGVIGSLIINVLHFVGLIDSIHPLRRIDESGKE